MNETFLKPGMTVTTKTSYSVKELETLRDFYSNQLLNDTVPFWFPRSYDREYSGFLLMRETGVNA